MFYSWFGFVGEYVNDTQIDITAELPGSGQGREGSNKTVRIEFRKETDELYIFCQPTNEEWKQKESIIPLDEYDRLLISLGFDERKRDSSHICLTTTLSSVKLLPLGSIKLRGTRFNQQLLIQLCNGVRPTFYVEPINPLEKKFDLDAVKHTWVQLASTDSVFTTYPSLANFIKLFSNCNLLYFNMVDQSKALESFLDAQAEKTYTSRLIRKFNHDGYNEAKRRLSFSIIWELKRLISCGIMTKSQITLEFVDLLQGEAEDFAVQMLTSNLPLLGSSLVRVFNENHQLVSKRYWKSNETAIRTLIITPTGMRFDSSKSSSRKNRVVRQFQKHSDYFLVVKFRDENPSVLLSAPISKYVIERIRNKLSRGINVHNRHYEFLAYSSSQLREHSCWFFATPPSNPECTAESIRKWMGNFTDIKNPAKYAARLGQCFSATYPPVPLDIRKILIEEDIVHNGFIFSDGIGRISMSLAAKLNTDGPIPSAFQVVLSFFLLFE